MPMDIDRIIDRRKLTRALTFWRIIAIVAVVGLVGISFVGGLGGSGGTGAGGIAGFGPYIARVEVSGVILDDPYRDDKLLEIKDDPQAKALVVRIDSPGGSVVGGEMLFKLLRSVAEEKPVVAVMGELATSAGYMTALGADHILAREGSVTGSIGVIMQTADLTGMLDKIGVKPEVIKSSDLKATPNPFETITDNQREAAKVLILDMYAMFKSMVAERRNYTPEQIDALADGRIFTGRQALKEGLVDAIGGELEAKAWLVAERGLNADINFKDIALEPEIGPIARLIEESVGKTLVSERLRLDGLISVWQPNFR